MIGIGHDINLLKKVDAENARLADDLARLIETANAPIFGVDQDGRVTEWNAKIAGLLGWSKREAMGLPLVDSFISEDLKDSVRSVLAGALSGRETSSFECPLFTKTGVALTSS
jgi:PAS domain S-box-containing protein